MAIRSTTRFNLSVAVIQALFFIYAWSTPALAADADPQLAARVKAALTQDQRIYTAHINVSAEAGGVVHLSGIVASDDDLNQAKRDAKSVAGVRTVVDELHIEGYAGR
jgi:osmotically-inducible protein OsmY